MTQHSRICSECGSGFVHVVNGRGRLPLTCSPACKNGRRLRLERARHRLNRGSLFQQRVRAIGETCAVDGCDTEVTAHGLCSMHYARYRHTGSPGPTGSLHDLCTVVGCFQPRWARGWCEVHYQRASRNGGDPGEPERRRRRTGEGSRSRGYVVLTRSDGSRVLEHRFVMEQILGRRLERYENVHHKNGRRDDNNPANLELWTKPQVTGQRVDDLVAWVVEHYPQAVRASLESRPSTHG